MSDVFSRVFRLRAGETGIMVTLGLLLLANSLAVEVSGVVAVSGFLDQVEVPNIIIIWAVDMVLIAIATGLQSLIVDRYERAAILRAMLIAFAMVYIILRAMFAMGIPEWLNYSALFLIADLQWLFFPLIFWILANDIFDVAQSKRLIPVIAAWGFAGQILGFGLAAVAPDILAGAKAQSAELLNLNALIYMVCFVVAWWGLRNIKVRQTTPQAESVRATLSEGWGFVKEVASFRYLMIALIGGYLVITVLDYHFLSVANDAFSDSASFQTFYSLYGLAVTVAGFIIQGLLSSRIIDRLTLKNTFLVLPLALLAMSGAALGFAGLAASALAIGVSRLTQETIDFSAQKAYQALVPEERRGRVALFMNSYLFSGGTLIGCLILGVVVIGGRLIYGQANPFIYLALAVVAAVIAIWAIVKMRGVYDASMLNWRLKRRQRGASVLDGIEF